ncbi:MAG: Coenzyme F420 hydrogenase/dehydrogenase, beta subunit C-terminal domain [Clostridium sp.]|uniref:Coenzyme F420 hydrogenase/dehydrogenase, beta subunit C-terminal domain n=1 Tax=Clostridium sp. TaxID=1506 RepID=UPI003F3928A3
MVNVEDKKKCCGCYGCQNVCPKKCITMVKDLEGFHYPKIDMKECIKCNLCEKVCPEINDVNINNKEHRKVYACRNNNYNKRIKSSSGGIFSLLCDEVIKENGVVFGAAFNGDFKLEHSYAENIDECNKFRGSKYLQSNIGNAFNEAKKFLNSGRVVLFSGTQCQIKGLNLYLNKKFKNLITVEVICHGVPSQLVFDKYRESKELEYKSKLKRVDFRDKNKGWKQFSMVLQFENGKEYRKVGNEDLYMKGFLNNLYLRQSCYKCNSKDFKSGSDISLADYWGIEDKHPEIYDNKGTSLVLVNTSKGSNYISKIMKFAQFIESDFEYSIETNPSIIRSVSYNNKRKRFFKNINRRDINFVIEDSLKIRLFDRIKNKIKYEFSREK